MTRQAAGGVPPSAAMSISPTPRSLARALAPALAVGAALLLSASDLADAQRRAPQAPAAPRADSLVQLDAARRIQRRFERVRRAALPVTDGVSRRACEATVGRYCYWHD